MNSAEKLRLLRRRMQEQGMDAYVVVTDDFHGSEYVGDYFKAREYLSGFTGAEAVGEAVKRVETLEDYRRLHGEYLERLLRTNDVHIHPERVPEATLDTVRRSV